MTQRKTALITGATSGIGRAFADRFASMGYDLIVTGRRKPFLESVAGEIARKHDVNVSVIIAELSRESDIRKIVGAIAGNERLVVLVNNAGYGLKGLFIENTIDANLALARTLAAAPMCLVHAALPGMIKRREGVIINVSSLGAWAPAPVNGVYGGAKAFLNVFTESLHMEVRRYGIKVQALCPGFTATDFHRQMGVEQEMQARRLYWMEPDDVVRYSLKCLERGKVVCVPGLVNRLLRALAGIVPRRLYYRMTERTGL